MSSSRATKSAEGTTSQKESNASKKSTASKHSSRRSNRRSNKSTASKESVKKAAPTENNKSWRTVAAEGIQSDAMAIIISFIVQTCFALFIIVEVFNSTGLALLYLVCVAVLFLVSLFFTLEIILNRTVPKLWLLISVAYTVVAIIPAIVMLILSTKHNTQLGEKSYKQEYHIKQEMELKIVQICTAVTIIVLVCHILALSHFYIRHYNFGRKESKDLETQREEKRANAGSSPCQEPEQVVLQEIWHSKKPPMAYMINAELQPVV